MTEQTNNRQSQLGAYVAIATTGAAALAVAAISNTITGAIDSLPPATTAGIVTSLPVTLVSMCGFFSIGTIGAAAFIVTWRTPRPAQRPTRDDDERMIVARPAQIQQPTIRQLPPPPTQPATIYTAWRGDLAHANERAALSAYRETIQYADEYREPKLTPPAALAPLPPAKLTVRLGDNGDEITLSRDAWISFVALDKPTRDEWRRQLASTKGAAPNSDYSKCNRIAVAYSALNGRGEWVSAEARQQLTAWVCPTPTPSE